MQIEQFNPTLAEIQSAVEKVKNLSIKGIDDEAGYLAVKEGKKELATLRIEITKFGKGQRQKALEWQREVIRQEKELLAKIEPEENRLKTEMEKVDEEKKRKERLILLPARKKMLEELQDLIPIISDDEIVAMDEKEFSAFYTEKKMLHTEAQQRAEAEKAEKEAREKEIEEAKKEAAEKAKKEAEEKAEREKKEEAERIEMEAKEKEKAEKAAKRKAEKNKAYKEWLDKNGVNDENKNSFEIKMGGTDSEGKTRFTLYKIIDTINI